MVKEIKRDYYLAQLIKREGNGLIKIVTGIRRCGKSYLLRTLFKNHLLENGVDEKHIVEMAFDLFDNSVNNSKITATTITKYIEYLEDAFLIEEANRYDIRGKSYIGTPLKYYFMDMGLRNSRIHYRQMEVTHSMENVIYNELRMRGFHVNVGNLTVIEKGKDTKPVKKQLEVDFICNKGSKKYYIQSAYMLETEAKMEQEIRPFLKINDSFKKIVITSDTPKPFYNDQGILIMNVYEFLLNTNSLEL